MTTTPAESTDLQHPATDERMAEGEHGHPSDSQYIVIALILAAVTAVEVGLYYVKDVNEHALSGALLLLAAAKFVIVVLYFMHLKFDNPALRRLFIAGFILALSVYAAYLLSLGVLIGS